MVEDRDYYYLVHEPMRHVTCVHMRTSCEGYASESEFIAQGADGADMWTLKNLAKMRMLERAVEFYESRL